MFERFTDRARRVVVLAQEEARRLGHTYVGTEHLLLGLVKEGEGVAARVLTGMGVDLGRVREAVERRAPEGGDSGSGHLPFTPRAKTALELSLREALGLGHNYIGTEHILLGLVREGHGVAWQILSEFGVEAEAVRTAVLEMLTGSSVAQAQPSEVGPGPRCPSCRSSLEGHIGWKVVTASGEEGADPRPARVYFCRSCDVALSVSDE